MTWGISCRVWCQMYRQRNTCALAKLFNDVLSLEVAFSWPEDEIPGETGKDLCRNKVSLSSSLPSLSFLVSFSILAAATKMPAVVARSPAGLRRRSLSSLMQRKTTAAKLLSMSNATIPRLFALYPSPASYVIPMPTYLPPLFLPPLFQS